MQALKSPLCEWVAVDIIIDAWDGRHLLPVLALPLSAFKPKGACFGGVGTSRSVERKKLDAAVDWLGRDRK